jgi:hypothetical protein
MDREHMLYEQDNIIHDAPNNIRITTNNNIYILNTYETFGKKRRVVSSNALELPSRGNEDQNMYMLLPPAMNMQLPPEMRNPMDLYQGMPGINIQR